MGTVGLTGIRGQGRSGWGGDWFGSDPLSKRVLYSGPDSLSKSIFLSRTPCQNQYKLGFSEEKQQEIELSLYRFQRFLTISIIKFINILL